MMDRERNSADQVTPKVWIGNKYAASDAEWLSSNGITHVINCAAELPNYFEKNIPGKLKLHYLKLNLQDSTDPSDDLLAVLEVSYGYLKSVLQSSNSNKVLVHCAAGISRSASIVIYYLMKIDAIRSRKNSATPPRTLGSFEKALEYLRGRRSIVRPNSWYTRQLLDAERLANDL